MPKENLHLHHRQRIKNKFLKSGFDNFNNHEILEFLLFFSIPRKDTNETAHKLLEKFGSITRVFEASVNELIAVDGIGMQSALLITLMRELFKVYSSDDFSDLKSIESYEEGGEYCASLFAGMTYEQVIMICLDASNKIIETVTLCKGSCNVANVNIKELVSKAISNRSSSVIIAHNHPLGLCIPSVDDLNTTAVIKKALSFLDITLKEHYIIANKNYIGINKVYTSE